jgi:hypothetical protein
MSKTIFLSAQTMPNKTLETITISFTQHHFLCHTHCKLPFSPQEAMRVALSALLNCGSSEKSWQIFRVISHCTPLTPTMPAASE